MPAFTRTISYAKGIHNIKAGAQYEQTFLREHDTLGVVDPTYNSPCVDASGNPLPGYSIHRSAWRLASRPFRIRISFTVLLPTT